MCEKGSPYSRIFHFEEEKPVKEQTEQVKKLVQEQFGTHADKYVTSSTHSKGTDILQEWLQLSSDAMVLDIATGGGHAAKALAPHAAYVFATDLTKDMLDNTRSFLASEPNIFFVTADAEALPFLNNTFDAAVCRIAAHHFPNPGSFVQEVARVLKPGGKFLLIDNVSPNDKELDEFVNHLEKIRDISHVRSYSLTEWSIWFKQAGLEKVNDEIRKKRFNYIEWVMRTTSSEEQVKEVDQHILSANEKIKEYYSINLSGNTIDTFEIDEWMVLFEKSE